MIRDRELFDIPLGAWWIFLRLTVPLMFVPALLFFALALWTMMSALAIVPLSLALLVAFYLVVLYPIWISARISRAMDRQVTVYLE